MGGGAWSVVSAGVPLGRSQQVSVGSGWRRLSGIRRARACREALEARECSFSSRAESPAPADRLRPGVKRPGLHRRLAGRTVPSAVRQAPGTLPQPGAATPTGVRRVRPPPSRPRTREQCTGPWASRPPFRTERSAPGMKMAAPSDAFLRAYDRTRDRATWGRRARSSGARACPLPGPRRDRAATAPTAASSIVALYATSVAFTYGRILAPGRHTDDETDEGQQGRSPARSDLSSSGPRSPATTCTAIDPSPDSRSSWATVRTSSAPLRPEAASASSLARGAAPNTGLAADPAAPRAPREPSTAASRAPSAHRP